jgi:hypothetical protein
MTKEMLVCKVRENGHTVHAPKLNKFPIKDQSPST